MQKYFIISKINIQLLALEVNEYLENGCECLGSPFLDNERNFNQAMLSKALKKEKEDQHLNNFNLNKTFEYFVMIKFKLRQDVDNQFFKEVENYLRKFPYEGLKFCEIFDLENDIGEYAFIEFFDNAENYIKAIDRRDNPILDKLRKFVIPYDNGEDFIGSHGKLTKSFSHLLI